MALAGPPASSPHHSGLCEERRSQPGGASWKLRTGAAATCTSSSFALPPGPSARACGASGFSVEDPAQCGTVLDQAFATQGPVLVEAIVDPFTPPMPPKVTAEQAGNIEQALQLAQDASVAAPTRSEPWFRMGDLHLKAAAAGDAKQHYQAAIEAYEKGIQVKPLGLVNVKGATEPIEAFAVQEEAEVQSTARKVFQWERLAGSPRSVRALLAQAGHRLEAVEGIPAHPPPPGRIEQPGQGVGDGVEVGGDVEPPAVEVIAGVADDGEPAGVHHPRQAQEEPGGPGPTRQERDHRGPRPPRPSPSGAGGASR